MPVFSVRKLRVLEKRLVILDQELAASLIHLSAISDRLEALVKRLEIRDAAAGIGSKYGRNRYS